MSLALIRRFDHPLSSFLSFPSLLSYFLLLTVLNPSYLIKIDFLTRLIEAFLGVLPVRYF
ncbi:hypothetical protein JGUZn3_08990 [Entomobacter blattae]|uniref:Uncharacterized protein n=1 Tax=Entomobacter blattae TaxID=2762277 RepID=A0A7H1NQS1_9PROT|nr:hypothetical protein JGUZn3_08990 [Entomobacter blattae]